MNLHNRKFIGDSSREDEFGFRVNIDRLLTRVGKLNKWSIECFTSPHNLCIEENDLKNSSLAA